MSGMRACVGHVFQCWLGPGTGEFVGVRSITGHVYIRKQLRYVNPTYRLMVQMVVEGFFVLTLPDLPDVPAAGCRSDPTLKLKSIIPGSASACHYLRAVLLLSHIKYAESRHCTSDIGYVRWQLQICI